MNLPLLIFAAVTLAIVLLCCVCVLLLDIRGHLCALRAIAELNPNQKKGVTLLERAQDELAELKRRLGVK